ncbi:MAG TPA: amidohydrolase family protein [Dongiaceae bacterium]|nr:amidohydrolase family protein [Dongiaceae bacterium]
MIDHHCHTLWRDYALRFREAFTESLDPAILSEHLPFGLGFRRELALLAELYGCEPAEEAVRAHRRPLADLLRDAGVSALLVDDGAPEDGLPLEDFARLADVPCHRILRIESVAQELLRQADAFETFERALRRELLSQPAVAFKSIAAYRAGLNVSTPIRAQAEGAFMELRGETAAGAPRIEGHPLEDWLLELALGVAEERRLAVQFHTGWGDADEDLRLANPLYLRPVIQAHPGVPLVLLHCWPYHREAGYLAAIYANVYVDLSLTIPHVSEPARILAETLEVCPVSKILYGSDAMGIPELFWLGARRWRDSLDAALPDEGLAALVLEGNARRLYKLSE